jgi:peroxiredoxin Q/BCP
MPITVGQLAPPLALETDTGERLSLKDLRGKTVVLYFYPKDDTTGCTKEACAFRDLFPRFKRSEAVILGVSPDSVSKHKKFKEKYSLPFTLLADVDHKVAEKYGIWVEKTFYGRKYMGVERTTYIIGPDGRIRAIFSKVNPEGHAEAVHAALKSPG